LRAGKKDLCVGNCVLIDPAKNIDGPVRRSKIDVPMLRATHPIWDLIADLKGIFIAGRYSRPDVTVAVKNALDCFLTIDMFAGKLLGRPTPHPGTSKRAG
jgi:hypothetical protein